MLKVKLVNKAKGNNKDTGKPWCRITLSVDKADGNRVIEGFWCNETVASKIKDIPLDAYVYVMAELDENLHFGISDIRPADVNKA